jgi:hypothetical protein
MADQFFDTSSQSWFSRIGGAFKGLIFGLIALPASIVLLFWNENHAVSVAQSLKEGALAVVSVPADAISPANEQKLIHLSGEVAAGEAIHDPQFNVSGTVLRLTRHVEMYQWKEEKHTETQKKLGGGEETVTRYDYTKAWSNRPEDSSNFKHPGDHTNPTTFPMQAATTLCPKATLGAFKIPGAIIEKMGGDRPLAATAEAIAPLSPELKSKARISGESVYLGGDFGAPAVGDVRVSFAALQPGTFSILAQQSGDTLAPYPTHEGREIERVESGTMDAALMFQHAQSENKILSWVLRLVGFIVMFIGFAAIMNPLHVFADVLPFVGSIIGFGTGLLAAILAFAGSLVVIAIAWLAARPLLGGSLLVLAIAAIVHGIMRVRSHGARMAGAGAAGAQ